ncbi:MAG: DUF2442 domain-containing protein [Pseudomonadota bacterium]
MLLDVVEVRPIKDKIVFLRFEDGLSGELNLEKHVKFTGIFAPLNNWKDFSEVCLNQDAGTICWPSGADLCPDMLYDWLSQENKHRVA